MKNLYGFIRNSNNTNIAGFFLFLTIVLLKLINQSKELNKKLF